MHRCYLAPPEWENDTLLVGGDEAHHLLRVLRVRRGDAVCVFDGCGRSVEGRVAEITSGHSPSVTLTVVAGTEFRQPQPVPVGVYAAVVKAGRMDWLVEKATELGATELVPLVTARTVASGARVDSARSERWRRIAVSAAKQCGTDWLPRIAEPTPLDAALPLALGMRLILVASLREGARPFRDVMRERADASASVAILVGPEGDFTDDELDACEAAGGVAVSLGALVLRAETAAICALSAARLLLAEGEPIAAERSP